MRPSNRTRILEAAVRVAEARGFNAVTMEAVAEEAGLTKGGLIYHFGSKEELLLGIQEHLAALWEQDLEATAGKSAAEATERERLVAYVRVSSRSATRAELIMQLESANDVALSAPWLAVLARWRPTFEIDQVDETALRAQVAVLAAEGLWSAEPLGAATIPQSARDRLIEYIVAGLGPHEE